jgi:hypothetical protein
MWAMANRLRSGNGKKKKFFSFLFSFDLRKFKRKGRLPISKFEESITSNPLLGRRKNKVSWTSFIFYIFYELKDASGILRFGPFGIAKENPNCKVMGVKYSSCSRKCHLGFWDLALLGLPGRIQIVKWWSVWSTALVQENTHQQLYCWKWCKGNHHFIIIQRRFSKSWETLSSF